MNKELINIETERFHYTDLEQLFANHRSGHAPRILLLYGSLRERSFSRLATEEAARILQELGAETKTFDPRGLPQPDTDDGSHPKVKELHELVDWSEGMVWCSPERHGSMTSIMKSQIDWIPLSIGSVRPTQAISG